MIIYSISSCGNNDSTCFPAFVFVSISLILLRFVPRKWYTHISYSTKRTELERRKNGENYNTYSGRCAYIWSGIQMLTRTKRLSGRLRIPFTNIWFQFHLIRNWNKSLIFIFVSANIQRHLSHSGHIFLHPLTAQHNFIRNIGECAHVP